MTEGGTGGGSGFWRTITRWGLSGANFKPEPGVRLIVDGYNWFMAQKTLNP